VSCEENDVAVDDWSGSLTLCCGDLDGEDNAADKIVFEAALPPSESISLLLMDSSKIEGISIELLDELSIGNSTSALSLANAIEGGGHMSSDDILAGDRLDIVVLFADDWCCVSSSLSLGALSIPSASCDASLEFVSASASFDKAESFS